MKMDAADLLSYSIMHQNYTPVMRHYTTIHMHTLTIVYLKDRLPFLNIFLISKSSH